MKLNYFICPHCGHDFYCDAAYATCDACQCLFYAGQSLTSKQSKPLDHAVAERAWII